MHINKKETQIYLIIKSSTMKKLLYLLLLFAGFATAQIVVIPDQDFKGKLLNASPSNQTVKGVNDGYITINTNGDNEIQESEALLAQELNVNNSLINDLSGIKSFTNLKKIYCSSNPLTTLDVSDMVTLETINFSECNNLGTVNVSGCLAMKAIDCQSCNGLHQIDVSTLVDLNSLNCPNCINLELIFAKNGKDTELTIGGSLGGTPTLKYICVDEERVSYAQGILDALPPSINRHASSLCTETPGGLYNTIKGNVSLDALSPKSYIKMKCTIGNTILETTTNADGDYVFYTKLSGAYTVSFAAENPTSYNNSAPLSGATGTTPSIVNFNLLASTALAYNDIEMIIAPTFSVQGQKTYLVTIKNKGNVSATGTMKIKFNDIALDLIIPAVLPVGLEFESYILNSGISNWKYTTPLEPCESRSFKLSFNIINDAIPFDVNTAINSNIEMVTPINVFNLQQGIVDTVLATNTIECLEGATVDQSQIGKYLHYMINLQNDGTGVANTIVIENTFDAQKYDINSLQIIGSTLESNNALPHPVMLDVKNNKATYSFRKAGNGGPGGHGTVAVKIKTKASLLPGSSVTNNVTVNFEYDEPINVNGTATTFANLKVAESQLDKSITIYPNPASSTVTVNGVNAIQMVQVYDAQGRLLQTNIGNAANFVIDIADKANGIYFLKVTSNKGIKVERVVKE
jgi:Secretion system C-terminal sorting domain